VSNFSLKLLSSLLAHPKTTIVPAVNQVEAHPCLPQHGLVKFCRSRGILLVAYSPVGKHKYALNEDILVIARRLDVTPAQVILSWGVQRGTAVVPKSEHEERLAENISVSRRSFSPRFMQSHVYYLFRLLTYLTMICKYLINFT
jgi:glycerol 2-dehydrogenase (NADP+)